MGWEWDKPCRNISKGVSVCLKESTVETVFYILCFIYLWACLTAALLHSAKLCYCCSARDLAQFPSLVLDLPGTGYGFPFTGKTEVAKIGLLSSTPKAVAL